jgi:hypothetical protein
MRNSVHGLDGTSCEISSWSLRLSVLVVIDDFTKWVEIFPLRDASDATAARIGKVLKESGFCRFGMPKTLVSDNGTNFTSSIMKYLCSQWNIIQRFTSYHPQSNLTKRVNRTEHYQGFENHALLH